MVYRKIAETCQGYEILERLTEEEIAAYYRNKKNRKKKEDRQAEVGGMARFLFDGRIFLFHGLWMDNWDIERREYNAGI